MHLNINALRYFQTLLFHILQNTKLFLSPVFVVFPLGDGFLEPQEVHVPLQVSHGVLLQAQHVHVLLEAHQGDVLLLKVGLG